MEACDASDSAPRSTDLEDVAAAPEPKASKIRKAIEFVKNPLIYYPILLMFLMLLRTCISSGEILLLYFTELRV